MSAEPARVKLYLLDVEGTVAPLTLTSEQLFPYARKHFEAFLKEYFADLQKNPESLNENPEGSVFWDVMMLALENRAETDPGAPRILPDLARIPGLPGNPNAVSMSPAAAIPRILAYVYWLMDRDRKSTSLKSLQGKIWKTGFESGELKGTLFADVPEAFKKWSATGKVAIYSSGSVEAQKLLFGHTVFGDLRPLLSGYFDTRTGPKMEPASYAAIAKAMGVAPGEAMFFSDVVKELDAAREAGMETRLVMREGNAPVDDPQGHRLVHVLD
jgi:2,3-diketo-5-methylthio-1-phosphopentane phosphatase